MGKFKRLEKLLYIYIYILKKSLNDTNINLSVKEFARPVDMAVS